MNKHFRWFLLSLVAATILVTGNSIFLMGKIAEGQNEVTDLYGIVADNSENAHVRINNILCQINPANYAYLQQISVKVIVPGGSGSGVLVSRRVAGILRTFVWTAGHVAVSLKTETGWDEATIYTEDRWGGLQTDSRAVKAKVVAYSPADEEDLALLEFVEDGAFPAYETVFTDKVQDVGTEVVHVGSTVGIYNSVSLGIVSQTDRDMGGKTFDQTSVMGYPGSSGGGVFLKDGSCIGLLTRGIGPGLNFIVPVRRMKAWAKTAGVEWAIDPSVPVPLSRTPLEIK
jgi:S1-C subfamily serine protease